MPQQPAMTLTDDERTSLESFVHRGKANARTLTRARLLLKSAEGWSTSELVAAFDVCPATVTNVRRLYWLLRTSVRRFAASSSLLSTIVAT